MKNLLPMIVYGIVVMLIVMVAALPAAAGPAVRLMPILAGACYVSFRQVLTSPADGAEHGPE